MGVRGGDGWEKKGRGKRNRGGMGEKEEERGERRKEGVEEGRERGRGEGRGEEAGNGVHPSQWTVTQHHCLSLLY